VEGHSARSLARSSQIFGNLGKSNIAHLSGNRRHSNPGNGLVREISRRPAYLRIPCTSKPSSAGLYEGSLLDCASVGSAVSPSIRVA
jgi:hypothetical protein